MILTSADRAREHVASGAWNHVTLNQLFKRNAVDFAGDVVFEDVGPGAVPGLASSLTYTEADRRIEGLAAFFANIGLKPDMVLGMHLPPCADAAIILLAALRAGLVVCPLPVYWTKSEVEAAIEAASIKGVVTASEIEGEAAGELIRDVAADTFAIRFVFAVGAGLPDGLIDLAEVLAEVDAFGPVPEVIRRGEASEHVALLSLAKTPDDRLAVVPYNHDQILAIALGHLMEAGMQRGETILSTMHPASLATVAGALAAGLISSSRLAFHHGTSLAGLADAARSAGASRVVLPEPLGPALAAVLPDTVALSLVGTGLGRTRPEAMAKERTTVDLVTLGGLCLIPRARDAAGQAVELASGPARVGGDGAPVLYEARIKPRSAAGDRRTQLTEGELLLGGAIIADAPWPEPQAGRAGAMLGVTSDGFLRTGLHVEMNGERLTITGSLIETIQLAGTTVSPARLDALFRRHPDFADAAVFPIAAGPVGNRLGLAVVPRSDVVPSLTELVAWLDGEQAGALDRPVVVMAVSEIPRAADGSVARDALVFRAAA
jgi:acyl-CoA synthetase (AMP-forming)/AMP-acid ligase II